MGSLINGAYLADEHGNLVYNAEQANCKYISKQCSPPFPSPFPGQFQNFSSIQVVELTKHVKAGDEYLVSYGTQYKKSHLSGAKKHAKATEDKENYQKEDLLIKTREGDWLLCNVCIAISNLMMEVHVCVPNIQYVFDCT